MALLLLLAFVVVPLVEIAVILRVGAAIGAGWTITLLVADSVLGAWLLRREGTRAWRQLRTALNEGRWPGDAVAHGALILVGGTLLVTPGFVTDVVGFLLLLKPGRELVMSLGRTGVARALFGPGAARAGSRSTRRRRPRAGGPSEPKRPSTSHGEVLDVEVVEIRRDEKSRPEIRPDDEPPTGR